MKSIINKYLMAFLSVMLLMTSCQKDESGFTANPEEKERFVKVDILGLVADLDDEPIQGALVTFNGVQVETDAFGSYKFSDVSVGNLHNALHIEKDGYFEGGRTFRAHTSTELIQRTKLYKKNFDLSFDAQSGGQVEKDNVEIEFSADMIVEESSGNKYDGMVSVAMHQISATDADLNEIMPGDLSGRNLNDDIDLLTTYGMAAVELRGSSGQKLQIAPNQTAKLSYSLESELSGDAPNAIPVWSFDFEEGLWIEEGTANLENGVYTAEVSHFSIWNYDVKDPSIILNGRILSNGLPLSGLSVQVLNFDNKGGRGITNLDGTFGGRVPAGRELELIVRSSYNFCLVDEALVERTIGPFGANTTLDDIEIELNVGEVIQVKATAIDCNGDLITNGYARYLDLFVPITDGILDYNYPVCTSGSAHIDIVDRNLLKSVRIDNISFPGTSELGMVTVCEDDVDNLTVNNLFQNQVVITDSLAIYTSIDEARLAAYSVLDDNYVVVDIEFNIVNGMLDNVHYLAKGGNIAYEGPNDSGFFNFVSGDVSITDPNNPTIGSYTFTGTDPDTQETKTFTGDFRITR